MGIGEKGARGFWDKMADGYARRPIADEEAYQHKLRLTQAFLMPNMDVLELGCGTGGTALEHAPFVRHIRATDISDEMLRHARERAQSAGVENVTFEQADLEGLSIAPESYDVVLAMNLLHLTEDPLAEMKRIHQWLKPGGIFVQSTGLVGHMNPLLRLALPVARMLGKAPFVNSFTEDQLEAWIDAAGFHVLQTYWPDAGAAKLVIARKAAE